MANLNDTEALDVREPGVMQILGHIIDGMINQNPEDAARTGFMLLVVVPDHESESSQIKFTGNMHNHNSKQVLMNALMQWPE